jgi:hypothetical protein
MTRIQEFVNAGVERGALIEALRKSAPTVEMDKTRLGERIYVGLKNIGKIMDDPSGERIGLREAAFDQPVLLRPARMTGGPIHFYELETGKNWSTGNGNITLSPWDSKKMLQEATGLQN